MNDRHDASQIPAEKSSSPRLSLFVACYNEEENVFGALTNVRDACVEIGIRYEIIVVDDGSKDRTSEVVQSWVKENPDVPLRLVRNPVNCGLSDGYVKAASLATGEWFRLICGDNVETKETFVTIFREIGTAEILLPYYVHSYGKAISRQAISLIYTFLINTLSGYWVHYYNGMALIRREYAVLYSETGLGFAFQADMVTQLLDAGLSLKEIAVTTHERLGGSSSALTGKNFYCVSKVFGRILFRRFRNLFRGAPSVKVAASDNR
jgi:glycosyltransferase involved in cell wall biosynthesis